MDYKVGDTFSNIRDSNLPFGQPKRYSLIKADKERNEYRLKNQQTQEITLHLKEDIDRDFEFIISTR